MLHIHLCKFQDPHRVMQCTTCQHTNYHHTTNHSRSLPTAWTASVMWYTYCKLACIIILVDFLLTYNFIFITTCLLINRPSSHDKKQLKLQQKNSHHKWIMTDNVLFDKNSRYSNLFINGHKLMIRIIEIKEILVKTNNDIPQKLLWM